MTNKQLRAIAKKAVRLPNAKFTHKETGKVVVNPYFIANPNAYKRCEVARMELARHGF